LLAIARSCTASWTTAATGLAVEKHMINPMLVNILLFVQPPISLCIQDWQESCCIEGGRQAPHGCATSNVGYDRNPASCSTHQIQLLPDKSKDADSFPHISFNIYNSSCVHDNHPRVHVRGLQLLALAGCCAGLTSWLHFCQLSTLFTPSTSI